MNQKLSFFTILFFLVTMFIQSCSSNLEHKSPYDPDSPPYMQVPATISGTISLEDESDCSGVDINVVGEHFTASVSTYREVTGSTECSFQISGIYPGVYRVSITTRYYEPVIFDALDLPLAGRVDLGKITLKLIRVKVTGTVQLQTEEEGSLDTPAGSLITVTRVGSIKSSLSNSSVRSFDAMEDNGEHFSFTTVAGADGSFTLNDVPAGVYNVVVEREGYAPGGVDNVVIGENEQTTQNLGVISLRKVTGDFEIVGYLAPLTVSSPEESNRYTATRNVRLNLYGFNAAQMIIVNGADDGSCDFSGGVWEEYEALKNWVLTEGDGTKYVCVRFRDLSGQESQVLKSSIILDTKPPQVYKFAPLSSEFLTYYNGVFYWRGGDTLPLEFSVMDEMSGVQGFYLEEDGRPLWSRSDIGNWVSFRNYYSVVLTSEGNHYIEGCFSDYAHNVTCTDEPVEIIKDTHVPTVQLDLYNEGVTNSLDVKFKLIADDGSNPAGNLLMKVSERDDFAGATWQPFRSEGVFHFTRDGQNSLYVKVKDLAGNESSVVSRSILIDVTPPTNVLFSPVRINVNSTNPYFRISADGASAFRVCESPDFSGSNCGWQSYPGSTSVAVEIEGTEGWHTVYLQFSDDAGNLTSVYSTQVFFDSIPPSADLLEITDENQFGFVNKLDLTLRLVATGATYMMVTGDVVGEGRWRDYAASYSVLLLPGDGEKEICVKYRDLAGNLSNVLCREVTLDTVPPLIESPFLSIDDGEMVNRRNVVLHLYLSSVEDPGEIQVEVSQHGSFYDADWMSYSGRITWTLEGDDGEKEIFVRFRDLAGNLSPANPGYYSVSVTLDTTPPDFKVFSALKPYVNTVSVPLILSATDNLSGNLEVSIAEDDGNLGADWNLLSRNISYSITDTEGEHDIYAVVRDEAGNLSVVRYTRVVYDRSPPSDGFVIIDDGKEFSTDPAGKLKLALSSYDALSGIELMELSENSDFSNSVVLPFSPTYAYTITGAGVGEERPVTIYARFRDHAGNWSSAVSDEIFYDTKPPLAKWVTIDGGSFWTDERDVVLDYSVSGARYIEISESSDFTDASWLPLILHPRYRISSASEGPVRIYVRFKDEAGNVSNVVYDDICMDLTPPASPVVTILSQHNGYTNGQVLSLKADAAFSPACVTTEVPVVRFSTSPDFSTGSGWIPFDETTTYFLGITDLSDGNVTVFAQFADQAGQLSEVAMDDVVKDTIPPENCSVDVVSGNLFNGIRYVKDSSVVLHLHAEDPSPVTFVVSNTYPPTGNGQTLIGYYTHILAPGDGLKTVYVRFYDMAGNYVDVSNGSIVLDTVPPSIPPLISQDEIVNSVTYEVERDNVPVDINFLRWECQGGVVDNFVPCGYSQTITQFTYTLKTGVPQFINTLRLRAVDKAGNVGNAAILQITYDNTPPTRPILANSNEKVYVNKDIYLIEVTTPSKDVNFDIYQYCVMDGEAFYCPDDQYVDSSLSLELPIPLEDNSLVTVFVRGRDKAGNVSPSDRVIIEEDSIPPSVPVIILNTTYANAVSMPIYLSGLSTDPSIVVPGSDNLDHYEISGGMDCETGMYYNNYDMGKDPGKWVCLFSDNGIPQLKDARMGVEIVAVDRAGNRSYPAEIVIDNKFTQSIIDESSQLALFSPTFMGVFYKNYLDQIFYRNYDRANSYSIDVNERLKQCSNFSSKGDSYIREGFSADGLSVYASVDGWLGNGLFKFDVKLGKGFSTRYMYPVGGEIRSVDADSNGVSWAYVGRGLKYDFTVTPSTTYDFNKLRCYFNVYEVTRETQIYGYYQYVSNAIISSDSRIFGVYGTYYNDNIQILNEIKLDCLGYSYVPDKGMVFVPADMHAEMGYKIVLGICSEDDYYPGTLLRGRDVLIADLPIRMDDMRLMGSADTYSPVVSADVYSINDVTVSTDHVYSQLVLTSRNKLMKNVFVNYARKRYYSDSRFAYDYSYPLTPGVVQELDEIPFVVNGYEELFFDDSNSLGTERVRGLRVRFNNDYRLTSVRVYLNCQGTSYVKGLVYHIDSNGNYSLAVSTDWVSTSVGFNEYKLYFNNGLLVNKDNEYAIAFIWKGDYCYYYYSYLGSPLSRPYGEVEGGVYYNGVTVPPAQLYETSTAYFTGFDLYQIDGTQDFEVKLSGRYVTVTYRENFDYSGPLNPEVIVYDLGKDLDYKTEGVRCVLDEGSDLIFGNTGLLSGRAAVSFFDTTEGVGYYGIHDFGKDMTPCTTDDVNLYSRVGQFTESNELIPSLTGYMDFTYEFTSFRGAYSWYETGEIYGYGNDWLGAVDPFRVASNEIINGDDFDNYGDIVFSKEDLFNDTNRIIRITPERYYPFSNSDVVNGFVLTSSRDFVVVRGYEYFNRAVQRSDLYVFNARDGRFIRKISSKLNEIDSATIVGNHIFLMENFYSDFNTNTPQAQLVNIDTGDVFTPSNIDLNYKVPDLYDGTIFYNINRADGNQFLFAEYDGSNYVLHIYDLGSDGLHLDEGSGDDRMDWIAPFPIAESHKILSFYLKDGYYAYQVTYTGSFTSTLVYGSLGSTSQVRIDGVERFIGIAGGYIVYSLREVDNFVFFRDLTTGETTKIYCEDEGWLSYEIGEVGNWIVLVDYNGNFWVFNPDTMESFSLSAGNITYSNLRNTVWGVHLYDDGTGYFLGVENGLRMIFRFEPDR